MTQAAAQYHAQHTVKQHVVEHGACEYALRVMLDAIAPQQNERRESDEIHKSIPSNGKRPEMDGDGVELRVNEHGFPLF